LFLSDSIDTSKFREMSVRFGRAQNMLPRISVELSAA
jgi:hypothetical protein